MERWLTWLRRYVVEVTIALVFEVTFGAVYRPVLSTEPAVADQMTHRIGGPLTVAVNCSFLIRRQRRALRSWLTLIVPPVALSTTREKKSGFLAQGGGVGDNHLEQKCL